MIGNRFEPEWVAQLRAEWSSLEQPGALPLHAGLERLHQALSANLTLVFVPEPTPHGWQLVAADVAGPNAFARSQELRALADSAAGQAMLFEAFDPYAVEAEHQNRVRALAAGCQLGEALGLAGEACARALICDGPRLLACLVAFGAVGVEPLEYALPPLRANLQRARAGALPALLDAVLDALPQPALLLSEHGRVEYANKRGLAWLDTPAARAELASLRLAAASGEQPARFALEPLETSGGDRYWLARLNDVDARIAKACSLWAVAEPERRVLERLLLGEANKDIARHLACSEVTVERRLTRLYRATGTHSRTHLLARLHAL